MRLRPSGRAGPVASRMGAFAEYQEQEAWTWEHMALTRARVISSSPALKARIEATIRNVLTRPREADIIANDVLEMRRAIGEEKGESDIWDLKRCRRRPGRYRIHRAVSATRSCRDQAGDLSKRQHFAGAGNAARLGLLSSAAADILRSAVRLYVDLTQILRLCVSAKSSPQRLVRICCSPSGAGGRRAELLRARGAGSRNPGRRSADPLELLGGEI